MNNLWRAYEYVKYLTRSIHLHGIHSPFVFDLNKAVFRERFPYYCFDEIESLRAKLELTDKKIDVDDLGAGSQKMKLKSRKISAITQSSLKDSKRAQALFRLAKFIGPKNVLELGTSFGLTTAYLAKASPNSRITSIEGSEQIAKIAKLNHKKLAIENIDLIVGNFDDVLGNVIDQYEQLDFVFFDGNHQTEATLNYFQLCLAKAKPESVFVFDDIYWSKGMKKAWTMIKNNDEVKVSIDLFHMGIVFFKTDQVKEHFTVYH